MGLQTGLTPVLALGFLEDASYKGLANHGEILSFCGYISAFIPTTGRMSFWLDDPPDIVFFRMSLGVLSYALH